MMVKKQVFGKTVYKYHRTFEQTIGIVKITKEYDKNGVFAGSRCFVEGMEVSGFDYQQFLRRVSENLPVWAYFCIAKKGISPYTFSISELQICSEWVFFRSNDAGFHAALCLLQFNRVVVVLAEVFNYPWNES